MPLARVATKVIAGHRLRDLDLPGWAESVGAGRVPRRRDLGHVAVKEAVLPFPRFPGVDTTLGPEMKSTGEVMGIGPSFPVAFHKATLAAGDRLPREGTVFISVCDADKAAVVGVADTLARLGIPAAGHLRHAHHARSATASRRSRCSSTPKAWSGAGRPGPGPTGRAGARRVRTR